MAIIQKETETSIQMIHRPIDSKQERKIQINRRNSNRTQSEWKWIEPKNCIENKI